MDSQKVDMFLMSNSKFFESFQLNIIRERLLQVDDNKWAQLQMIQFKDPTTSLIVSLLGGTLGIDRFIIGDTGLGWKKRMIPTQQKRSYPFTFLHNQSSRCKYKLFFS